MARVADPALAQRRRRQILEAALQCFRRRGFHQASMQEICAEAEMSPGAVYRYFPAKTDIIAAIAEAERAAMLQELARFDPEAPTIDWIARFCEAAWARTTAFGGGLIADVMAEASRNPELAARLRKEDSPLAHALEGAIRRGGARGDVDPGVDPATAARVIGTYLDGLILGCAVAAPEDIADAPKDLRVFLARLLRPSPAAEPAGMDNRSPQRGKVAPMRAEGVDA